MWLRALPQLLLLASAFVPLLSALELPTSLAEQARSDLDRILTAAHVDFAPISTDAAQAQNSAKTLLTTTQRARIAIAQHTVDSAPLHTTRAAVATAKALQDELMGRAQSHLVAQLDGRQGLGEVEMRLHRGFKEGAVETEGAGFTSEVLQPGKWRVAGTRLGEDATAKQRMVYVWERIKEVLRNMDPVAATRRWRIRRLLRKLSTPPKPSPTPPLSADVDAPPPAPHDPVPWNMVQLRARLSSITALKSTQSQSAAADARDAAAAARIENAPVIQSNAVLPPKPPVSPPRMQKVAMLKDRPGADGTPAERTWARTFRKTQGRQPPDWDVPIPAMPPIAGAPMIAGVA
ncbi:conserved hypothetical protein [Sporisorium reilianum SRZ2]|uniref:Uncharacterized protein n=1 Tax=Sporisorium reilianum (strain SRZ2) TaxID=999809 RepID=E6ZQY7_SPORE|nr:conserved hypothetical protein [Sporisorium reilianum SRZ2]